MKKNLVLIMLLAMVSVPVFSLDVSSVYLYPVPFNPNIHSGGIKIAIPAAYDVAISVYDVNGDTILERSYSSVNSGDVVWNGRNGAGNRVSAGLYIVKVEMEDGSGDYGRKVIRVLVKN